MKNACGKYLNIVSIYIKLQDRKLILVVSLYFSLFVSFCLLFLSLIVNCVHTRICLSARVKSSSELLKSFGGKFTSGCTKSESYLSNLVFQRS